MRSLPSSYHSPHTPSKMHLVLIHTEYPVFLFPSQYMTPPFPQLGKAELWKTSKIHLFSQYRNIIVKSLVGFTLWKFSPSPTPSQSKCHLLPGLWQWPNSISPLILTSRCYQNYIFFNVNVMSLIPSSSTFPDP